MKPRSAIQGLGVYLALNASAVQFNSIVFRVVVGFLIGAPLEVIAYITYIEYALNTILEIPTGRLADKYGRVPMAILGHLTVIIGLSCGYTASSGFIEDDQLIHLFYIMHGVFIGFCRPLLSGSVDAFYKDAMKKLGEAQADLGFSLSVRYGKYLTTFYIALAFILLIGFHYTIGAQHAFIVGIILWIATGLKLFSDYKEFGDSNKTTTETKEIFSKFFSNKNILVSTFYNLFQWMIKCIVFGYFLVSFGREFSEASPILLWGAMASFMIGAQGFGWILKSSIIPKLVGNMKERNYIILFFMGSALSGLIGRYALMDGNLSMLSIIGFFIFGMLVFSSMSALDRYSKDKLTKEVESSDYAMFLSIQNMPGYLFVVIHGLYYAHFKDGAPSLDEIFFQVSVLSVLCSVIVWGLSKNSNQEELVHERN